MRVLILTIYHDPEPIPKTGELARELLRRGHQVHVVTAFPHYPSGRLYPGYRLALWRRERRDGVPILRTFIYPYHGSNMLLRIVNYGTWMCSAILASVLTPACDVMYVWHPPLTVGVSAWAISKLKRIKFVYDVQDLWPESAVASGLMRPGRLVDFLRRLADWVYARADRILVVSDEAVAYLRGRGVDASKVSVAEHWVDTVAFDRESTRDIRAEYAPKAAFVAMFAGNLGMVQGLETIVEAAALLRDRADIEIVFVGDGADKERLEGLVAGARLSNVRFLGRHPADEMPAFLRAADALLVHVRRSEIAEHAIPTKILSYLAAGRPIVCGMGGAAADLVRKARAGVAVPPGDSARFAEAIRQMASMPSESREQLGASGRRYFLAHFDKSRVIDRYERALLDVARDRRLRPVAAGQRT